MCKQTKKRQDGLLNGSKNLSNLLLKSCKQSLFFLVESIQKKAKFYVTIVYASNAGMERKNLWRDLKIQKQITNGTPWGILGDFNVTVNEHSNGSSKLC